MIKFSQQLVQKVLGSCKESFGLKLNSAWSEKRIFSLLSVGPNIFFACNFDHENNGLENSNSLVIYCIVITLFCFCLSVFVLL